MRKKLLQRFAAKILAAKEELALLETLDMGKPIQYSLAVDVPSTARTIAWYAEAIDKVYDEIAPTPSTALALITREPMGVIGCRRALELPDDHGGLEARAGAGHGQLGGAEAEREVAVHRAAPGRAGGRSRHPAGRLQRRAGTTATRPAKRWRCTWTSMPSASPAARASAARCSSTPAAATCKRVYNELGGKSAFVVFDDFANVERAAKTAAGSMFFNQGESCNAPSRVLVHESVAERFVEIVAAEAPKYRCRRSAGRRSTEMGALVDEGQLRTVLGYIDAGRNPA